MSTPKPDYKALLLGLIKFTEPEAENGEFGVMLRYDNYQDVAEVRDADGNLLSRCLLLDELPGEDPQDHVIRQFLHAIELAIKQDEPS